MGEKVLNLSYVSSSVTPVYRWSLTEREQLYLDDVCNYRTVEGKQAAEVMYKYCRSRSL